MEKPNIIALPTSQMYKFCDILGIPREKQRSIESMVPLLEKADFGKLKKGVTHGFDPDVMEDWIVESRKVRLGRS